MFAVFPYRVKNPPKSFPIATVTLIAVNVLVFAATSYRFLVIRPDVVERWAMCWGVTPPITILTSTFLHHDLGHLLGNMVFLWIFGPAVEDRLKVPGYLGVYALTGFAGSVAHVMLGSVAGRPVPTLGASGCIMGILGAYWYLFPWSKVCVAYFVWLFIKVWYGVIEVAAIWVIGFYFVGDLFHGCLGRAYATSGGVANFAHVGGALCGALLMYLLHVKRDSAKVSNARAVHSDVKSIDNLTCTEMRELVAASPEDEALLVRFAYKAREMGTAEDIEFALTVGHRIIVAQCPEVMAHYLFSIGGSTNLLDPGDLLCLGRWCEHKASSNQAIRLYHLLRIEHPEAPEIEMALMRCADIEWNIRHDSREALACLEELLAEFPRGRMVLEAEDLQESIRTARPSGRFAA
jgi:membrane associated rhomboid family serine protease